MPNAVFVLVFYFLTWWEQEVYRFLGLCPVDVGSLADENVTPQPDIPDHKKINSKTFKVP